MLKMKFQSMTVARKLGLLTLSAVLGLILLTALFLVSERQLILEERQANVRQAVETAYGTLLHYHDQVSKGALSEESAKAMAMQAIKILRYSGNEYFWINDMHPRMVMHPIRPEMDGSDLSQNKDPNGKRLFVEFVNTVKASGAGFVNYYWPKPGSDEPVRKISYVKGFAPWGWVIGSGVYVDSVEATIRDRMIKFSLGGLLLAGVMLVVCSIIARGLLKQLGGEQ